MVSAAAALDNAGKAVEAVEPPKKKAKKVTLRLSNGAMYTRFASKHYVYWATLKITP